MILTGSHNSPRVPRFPFIAQESLLDYFIVAALLLIPHSFFMNFATSVFPSLRFQQVLFVLLPALLVTTKLIRCRMQLHAALAKRALPYLGFVLFGLAVSLFHTDYPGYQCVIYLYTLYWPFLVLLYLCSSRERANYHLNLIVSFYVHIACIAALYYVATAFTGARLHLFDIYTTDIFNEPIAFPYTNLTFVTSHSPWFDYRVPRFTFLYQEPRILGTKIVAGFILIIGFCAAARPQDKLRYRFLLVILTLSFLIIHSTWGYIALGTALFILLFDFLGEKHLSSYYLLLAAILLSSAVIFLVALSLDPQIMRAVAELQVMQYGTAAIDLVEQNKVEGAGLTVLVENIASYMNILYFPFGTGMIFHDSERYLAEFGIQVSGAPGILGHFMINAGIFGIAFFVFLYHKAVKAMSVNKRRGGSPVYHYFLVMVVFFLVGSVIADMLHFTTTLFFNAFLTEMILLDGR